MNNFVGVVEDIFDPEKMGRVRVRITGIHTDDKTLIPTESLPWAMVATPTTSPSVSGLGHTPFLSMGSWVVGFFYDDKMQDPIITGSLPSKPGEKRDKSKGFSDPSGTYPLWTEDSDIAYNAREEKFEEHDSFSTKDVNRVEGVTTAVPPKLSTVDSGNYAASYFERGSFSEPPPSNDHRPEYPFNHVYETMSGHIEEFDDTPNNRRYHRYHPAGTYEEIYDDGSRTIKVVGHDYEIVMSGKDIFINGDCNLTVAGDMRQFVQGDHHLEVSGDYTMNIHGSVQTKIGGNQQTEVIYNRSTNVGWNDYLQVNKKMEEIIGAGYRGTVTADYDLAVNGSRKVVTALSDQLHAGAASIGAMTTLALGAAVKTDISSLSAVTIKSSGVVTVTAAGLLKCVGSLIHLN